MRVAFIHPDLGIGGAERWVVDAAVGLQNLGHEVDIYTSYCNKSHCFDEVRDGQLKVTVLGDTICPHTIKGKFAIFCATFRQLHLAYELKKGSGNKVDVFVVDQLSACVPLLKLWFPKARVLFYGHFPDQLLVQNRNQMSLVKKAYRYPFDKFEEITTASADRLVVNSHFTKDMFEKTFPATKDPLVIYPCVDTDIKEQQQSLDKAMITAASQYTVLLSINRFERKKNILLAIEAFGEAQKKSSNLRLAVAGGYDFRVNENVEYLQELILACDKLKLTHISVTADKYAKLLEKDSPAAVWASIFKHDVIFFPSASNSFKNTLLHISKLLLYTPQNEHFGIVPLEGMLWKTPVLATNSGGPLETVKDNVGWTVEGKSELWAAVIEKVVDMNPSDYAVLQTECVNWVNRFSQDTMATELEEAMEEVRKKAPTENVGWDYIRLGMWYSVLMFMSLCIVLLAIWP
ncbi:Alpha-1,3/1,6-mannosyltransferase ALG2 [Yarrowia sp. B02]|nr:Alpha-1,3/1,6-mannosyltransferase ALG2 [Yarrowia sp. B02]